MEFAIRVVLNQSTRLQVTPTAAEAGHLGLRRQRQIQAILEEKGKGKVKQGKRNIAQTDAENQGKIPSWWQLLVLIH